MVFSSLLFTYYFLPIVLIVYYAAAGPLRRLRNYILLAASLAFYGYGEPFFVFVMAGSILINYLLALLIGLFREKKGTKTAVLVLAVILNVGLLFVYKYLTFLSANLNRFFGTSFRIQIALPIGISFFTFQALSYVIDVYRETTEVQKNPFYLALYISFFPQLIAGPIVRYNTIADQIRNRRHTLKKFADGSRRFFLGFAKKVILANNLAVMSDGIFRMTNARMETGTGVLWLGALCYSLQIYYDFSGYSDMAIGLGKLFGFRFEENFRYPYISSCVADFWRRWHISLGSWFRDYVYIPLGGSRVKAPRLILNLFVVWLLTGIWHGANWTFLFWGLWYFVLLVLEKILVRPEKRPLPFRIFWRICTLLFVMFGWVIFNSAGMGATLNYWRGMFGFYAATGTATDIPVFNAVFHLREYGIYLLAGIVFATPVMPFIGRLLDQNRVTGLIKDFIRPFAYGFVFLWAVSFLILGVHNPFIYFNF